MGKKEIPVNDSQDENAIQAGQNVAANQSDPYNELVQRMPIETDMNAIIVVNVGKLYLDDCLLALK